MLWYQILIVLITGIVAGFINTVAGGGSSLTLPVLMFMGLPPNVANGTNRVAILLQSIAGVNTFRTNKIITFREGHRLIWPSVAGALAGALIAVEISHEVMKWFIVAIMAGMLLLVIFKPETWVRKQSGIRTGNPGLMNQVIFFLIGFYGGFIQVGVGFLLLAGLVVGCGFDMVKGNALKVLIVLVYTVISIVVFWTSNQVDLGMGLLLGAGSMIGAYAGAKFTIRGGVVYIRYFLIIALVAMILKLCGIF
jgi:uncharacterized membrane protein YfcA